MKLKVPIDPEPSLAKSYTFGKKKVAYPKPIQTQPMYTSRFEPRKKVLTSQTPTQRSFNPGWRQVDIKKTLTPRVAHSSRVIYETPIKKSVNVYKKVESNPVKTSRYIPFHASEVNEFVGSRPLRKNEYMVESMVKNIDNGLQRPPKRYQLWVV